MNTAALHPHLHPHPHPHPCLGELRFASWLELTISGVLLRWQELGTRVVVRLVDLQGSQAWWGITLDDCWLRGGNGAVTIFDSLPAADRFLRLLKVHRFNIGEHWEHGPFVAGQAQEVYTLGDRCDRCLRSSCGANVDQVVFYCPQLSQQRLTMTGNLPACQPWGRDSFVPVPMPVSAPLAA